MEFGTFQRGNEPAAEGQRHQLRGREAQAGDVPKSLHQTPAGLTVDAFGDEGVTGFFQRSKIAPESARMASGAWRERLSQLLQREALPRRLQLLQHHQQTHRLIVARHRLSAPVPVDCGASLPGWPEGEKSVGEGEEQMANGRW